MCRNMQDWLIVSRLDFFAPQHVHAQSDAICAGERWGPVYQSIKFINIQSM
jgi:hypothetical protein